MTRSHLKSWLREILEIKRSVSQTETIRLPTVRELSERYPVSISTIYRWGRG